jgi:endonuclease/exonuclease/phosphatase family metal-dependent hydrolase
MAFTVLSYNIMRGGEERLALIGDVVRSQKADVVALIEANDRTNADMLATELRMDLALGEANSPHHVAWLSHYPLVCVRNHRLPVLSRTVLEVTVPVHDQPIHLFATHLAPIWEDVSTVRLVEADAVLDVLQPHRTDPLLLVGDFNALHPEDRVGTPPDRDVRDWKGAFRAPRHVIQRFLDFGLVDCYRAVHPKASGYTFPSDFPWARIDFIFASPVMARRLGRCDVVTGGKVAAASDHLPVCAVFA